jgi:hypothetical protein
LAACFEYYYDIAVGIARDVPLWLRPPSKMDA